MGNPIVSINCLTYNHAPYIRQCLNGFIMQKTEFPFEVLIHDDASTDGTADIIREYESKYPDLIKPIYQTENQYSKGVKISRIFNYPRIKGKYIAYCEGDDYWIDDSFLQTGIKFLEENTEYNCYAANTIYDNHITGEKKQWVQDERCEQLGHDLSFANWKYLHVSARIYRKIIDVMEEINKIPYAGEIILWYKYMDIGKVYFDHKVASVYNITGKGVWSGATKKYKFKRGTLSCLTGAKVTSLKYLDYFWRILPKNIFRKIIKNLFGIKFTFKLLGNVKYLTNYKKFY